MTELAQRAVACRHWRWMPGMRVQYIDYGEPTDGHGRYLGLGIQAGDLCVQWEDYAPRGHLGANWSTPQNFRPAPHILDVVLPDLTDPATLGCLLALVREAWDVGYGENKYAYIAVNPPVTPHMGEPWSVVVCDHNGEWPFGFDGDTEAEALIEALEAAP